MEGEGEPLGPFRIPRDSKKGMIGALGIPRNPYSSGVDAVLDSSFTELTCLDPKESLGIQKKGDT